MSRMKILEVSLLFPPPADCPKCNGQGFVPIWDTRNYPPKLRREPCLHFGMTVIKEEGHYGKV